MIRQIVPALLIIIFFFISLFAYEKLAGPIPFSLNSVTTTKSDTFNVTGEGKVNVSPDVAIVSAGISAEGTSVKIVQDQINSVINKVSDAVKNLGVDSKDIQTTNYNINPKYDFTSGTQRVNGFTFEVSDKEKAENEAREMAVADAKKKAQQAAKVAGFSLGRLINYQENLGEPPIVFQRGGAELAAQDSKTQVEPGSSEITVSVTLSYEVR